MRANLALFTTACLWGLNFHFAGFMLTESSFLEAALWRYVLGVGVLLLLTGYQLRDLRLTREQFGGAAFTGLVGLFGFNLFFFLGLRYTSPLNAALIASLNPLLVIGFSRLLNKTVIRPRQILGAAISLVGVLWLLGKGEFSALLELDFNRGDLLILISASTFALYHLLAKKYGQGIANSVFTLLTNGICLVAFLLVALLVPTGLTLQHTPAYWGWAVGIGVGGTAVAYLLWNWGLSRAGTSRAGLFLNVIPLAAALAAVWWGAPVLPFHLVSGALILTGIGVSGR